MKKFVFWAMMTLGVVGLQSCDKDDDDRLQVSANLQEAFDTRYPNVSRVDWEQKGQFYEAEFADNGYENKAWFTPDGVWVMTDMTFLLLNYRKLCKMHLKPVHTHHGE